MKTLYLFFTLFILSQLNAQDEFITFTATDSNISGNAAIIDHPYLNDNPEAVLVVSHLWNPLGEGGVYNTIATGVFYSTDFNKWVIYNLDATAFPPNTSFFIYIPGSIYGVVHTVASAGVYSILDYSGINNDEEACVVVSPTYSASVGYINENVGLWYGDTNQWNLYYESGNSFEAQEKFMIAITGENQVPYRHVATASTIDGNWTRIDHPMLNDNPNAQFVFLHNWGAQDDPENVIYDEVAGAWYDGSKWAIFSEDLSAFPENAMFNLVIDATTMGIDEVEMVKTTFFPNPVIDEIHFSSPFKIEEIHIYNMAGEELIKAKGTASMETLNISKLTSGVYVVIIKTEKGTESFKMIKK